MRMATRSIKSNPNLLYSNFKRVEDYDPEDPDLLAHRKTPNYLKSKKQVTKDEIDQVPSANEFDELPLEAQIEVMMRPITNPNDKVKHAKQRYEEQESLRYVKEDDHKLVENAYDMDPNSKILLEDSLPPENNSNFNSTKASPQPKYSISLPPIKDFDPFSTKNGAAKHWQFNQPIKYSSTRSHTNSVNSTICDTKRNHLEQRSPKTQTEPIYKHVKSRSQSKAPNPLEYSATKSQRMYNLPNNSHLEQQTLRSENMPQIPLYVEEGSAPRLHQFNLDNHTSSILQQLNDPKLVSTEDMMTNKRVSFLQNASNEANHLLKMEPTEGDLDQFNKNLLDLNQARSEYKLADSDKRGLDYTYRENKSMFSPASNRLNMSKASIIHSKERDELKEFLPVIEKKLSQTPSSNRKDFYNKWFVPVKYWKITKQTDSIERKHELLKKDINYFYNNMHNYNSLYKVNPLKDKEQKNEQQINYETIQEKLKQNVTIRKYKKQLAENHQRIPNFLRTIEEEEKN